MLFFRKVEPKRNVIFLENNGKMSLYSFSMAQPQSHKITNLNTKTK